MNRRQRRAHERLRARQAAERRTPEERAALDARLRAVIASVSGLPMPVDPTGLVLLAAEHLPPALATWRLLPTVLRELGIELHEDTARDVDARMARGELPIITCLDGWVDVQGALVMPLSRGGVA